MRRALVAFCAWLGALQFAVAQSLPVGDNESPGTDITVEIDSSHAKNENRSLAIALFSSAVLPGSGEAYLHEEKSAKVFLLAEIGFWAGVFFAWQARDGYLQSARNFAAEYAGANTAGQGEAYLNVLANYRSSTEMQHRQDSYELSQVLSGQRDGNYALPITGNDSWDFGSSNTPQNTQNWKDYQSILRSYRGAKVALSFAVGALILNRVSSLAHTLRVYRRTSNHGLSFRVDPEISPEASGLRLSLAF